MSQNTAWVQPSPILQSGLRLRTVATRYLDQYLKVYRTGDIRPDLCRLQALVSSLPDEPGIEDVHRFFSEFEGTPSTRNRYRSLLHHLLKWSQKCGWVQRFPELGLERETNQRDVRLSADQEAALVKALPLEMQQLYLAACDTGLRRGALCRLTEKHCDLDRRVITVPASFQKHRKVQKIPMTPRMVEILTQRRQDTPMDQPLFVWNRYKWDKARRSAGLNHFRWHDLRHEFGSRLLDQRVSLPTIQRLLGHEQITTTMRYLNATDVEDEDRAAIARLG